MMEHREGRGRDSMVSNVTAPWQRHMYMSGRTGVSSSEAAIFHNDIQADLEICNFLIIYGASPSAAGPLDG